MRKIIPLLIVLLPIISSAQEEKKEEKKSAGLPKNAIKVNLSSLAFRNYHVQYERKLAKKISFNLGFRYMPDGGLPMESLVRNYFPDIFENGYVDIGKFTAGNISITPEFRWYLSRQAMKGFYIAPYARYTSFDIGLPLKYDYDSDGPGPGTARTYKTAVFNGKINSFSGGLMFGTQFNLGKRIVLDIWWLGGHYGSSSGDLDLITSLPTQEERDAVRDVIDKYKADVKPFEYERVGPVTTTGAKIQSTGPWAGIRGLGINLGFRF